MNIRKNIDYSEMYAELDMLMAKERKRLTTTRLSFPQLL